MSTAQTRTILGPLTTTFTPTPACSAQVLECPLPTCTLAWQAQTCYSSGDSAGIEDNSDCWPPRSGSVTETTHNPTLAGWGFYSPGLVCPSGFVSACSATFGESWGWPVQYSIFEGETAVGCCPSGYACINTGTQTCLSTVSGVFSGVVCESGTSGSVSSYTIPITTSVTGIQGDGQTVTSLITITTYDVYAPLIQINWQSSDLPTTITTASSGSSLPSPTSASPTSASQPPSGLSSGASAGLGVGVTLGVVAIALLLFLFYRRTKHNYKPTGQLSPSTTGPGLHELAGTKNEPAYVYELPNTGGVPHGATERISELDG